MRTVTQNEKSQSNTTTAKLYPAKKWETNTRQQCIKNKHLSDCLLYCYFIIQKVYLVSGQFIELHKNHIDNLFFFLLKAAEAFLEQSQTFIVGPFCKKKSTAEGC